MARLRPTHSDSFVQGPIMKFLEGYGGQTIAQLIAMKDHYRIDSLVLAVEQALGGRPEDELTEPERVVLAVEAMEREVNNGGYDQFFINSSRTYAGTLVRALMLIGCPKAAAISADAIAVLAVPNAGDRNAVREAAFDLSDAGTHLLHACDARYYANDENIAQQLFAYIEAHQLEIRLYPN